MTEKKILPTLLQENTVVPAKWMDKNEITNYTAVEFIRRYFAKRIPQKRHQQIGKNIGDKVFAIKAGTASGKSTVLPPMFYNNYVHSINKNIAVTQPRVFNAINIPSQIIEHNKEFALNKNIGYLTGTVKKTMVKGLRFMTIGILLQQLKTMDDEQFMREYSIIIVDECHVRSSENDLTLAYLKKLLLRNCTHEECPCVILMSATLDKELYMRFFSMPSDHYIEVRGQSFPITEVWPEGPIDNIDKHIVQTIHNICVDEDKGSFTDKNKGSSPDDAKNEQFVFAKTVFSDILIFVDSNVMAKNLKASIDRMNEENKFKLLTIVLNRTNYNASSSEYEQVITPIERLAGKYQRKVFISTNIAETGVTINTVKYCIDTGYQVYVEFDPIHGIKVLTTKAVTKAAAIQRRGRVGRVAPGVWYPLYSKDLFEQFTDDTLPDVLVSDITSNILSYLINEARLVFKTFTSHGKIIHEAEVGNSDVSLAEFDWPSNPSMDSIIYSLEKLYMLGFIDTDVGTDAKKASAPFVVSEKIKTAYIPTILGIIANRFRKIRCEYIRMILSGYVHGANIMDLITIAAFQDRGLKFGRNYTPFNPLKLNPAESNMYFKIVFADEFLEYIWMYDALKSVGTSLASIHKFCEKHSISERELLEGLSFRDELIENLLSVGLDPSYNGLDITEYNLVDILRGNLEDGIGEICKIKKCLYDGFRMQLATYDNGLEKYVMVHRKQIVDVIDSDILRTVYNLDVTQKRPRNIIMNDCILRNGLVKMASPISVLDGFVEVDERFAM